MEEGVPFTYADCARLAPTNEVFSLVVAAWPPMKFTGAQVSAGITASGAEARVSRWYESGFQLSDTADSEWAVDVVVV